MKAKITIEALDSGYIVTRREWNAAQYWSHNKHRTAEATLTGALGIAARALGYHGTIEFGRLDSMLVGASGNESPKGSLITVSELNSAGARLAREVESALALAVPVVDDPAAYAPPGVPFDAEEPPLRAGTAMKPDDLL